MPPKGPSRKKKKTLFRHATRRVGSVAGLLEYLNEYAEEGPVWYRGLTDRGYKLFSSMHVKKALPIELSLIDRFKQNAPQFLEHELTGTWDWLFVMRHHGAPSRLLDWTESPLLGLYFATGGKPDKEGALWCLLPAELNRQSGLDHDDIPMIEDDNDDFFAYRPSSIYGPGVSEEIKPIAGIAPRSTGRMQAQLGVFTVAHKGAIAVEDIGDRKHIWRFVIPAEEKEPLREELRNLGITRLSVFPDLDSVVDQAWRTLRG